MAEYIPLQKLYYTYASSERDSLIKEDVLKRIEAASTFRTRIKLETGELFLAMPKELTILNERLLRVERKVSHLWRELPGIAQWSYLRGLVMNEIVSTNEIEGIHSTRRQIEDALKSAEADSATTDYKRFREFANLYLELTNKNHIYPQTPQDIRSIYDAVVAGELDDGQQPDGSIFRKDAVDVMSPRQTVVHRGVMPESRIIEMIEQMIALMESPDIPPTFAAIMAHFLFEYIHPFYDGNGRTGRYLLALYLSEPLSLATVLSLSSVIAENKGKYYKAFKTAEDRLNQSEVTFFVMQMMEFIRLAQDSLMENLERKKVLLERAKESLRDTAKEPYTLSERQQTVIFLAVQNHLFDMFSEISLDDIASYSGTSTQTARKYTLELEEKGLLHPIAFRPLKFKLTQEALTFFDIAEA